MSTNSMQTNLFSNVSTSQSEALSPLAHRFRPKKLREFVGQTDAIKKLKNLKNRSYRGIILWGPPGSGKTTLAHILGDELGLEVYPFNAVLGGIAELKKLIESLLETKKLTGKNGIIFIDEIHRFNKSQQDALLPYVEQGSFLLIGATTEYPKTSLNKALLSRTEVVELKKLSTPEIIEILTRTLVDLNLTLDEKKLALIAEASSGDARRALSNLEIIANHQAQLNFEEIHQILLDNAREYDKNSNRHYDVISAFIKSMRGSDVNAALLWLAVMLDGGEDPVFIARRMIIFASEDIGMANPQALLMAQAALQACKEIGMPEVRINLGHVVSYLALSAKSNKAYEAINQALDFVRQQGTIEVPEYLKSSPTPLHSEKYLYSHAHPDAKQSYTSIPIPIFYKTE